ncbi:hypothetical protein [Alkaliphilus transvaalensis]|uniref:hypothetical protein n=1 Tax=Alkaliphilus transvaalensis TaxID=114628 RepID=UPI00047D1848|nr:hypothetical protein [Alkaliphilus transvaalensis]
MKLNLKPDITLSTLLIYEIIMIAISAFIVILSIWNLFFIFSTDTYLLIRRIDFIVCGVFAIDLILHLIFAKDKIQCMKKSIITVIAIVPFASLFRIAGILRINRIFFLLKSPTISAGSGLAKLWHFFMTPAVIRISKFFNLARSYFKKHTDSQDQE